MLDLDPTGTYRRPRETRDTRHKQRQQLASLELDPTGQY
ncbi:peptide tarsal-less AA [Drosophila innubila]|nr:peptide tarsal-less AA [Drosophila innubila]